jgi:endo-1,4-beta-xylanase
MKTKKEMPRLFVILFLLVAGIFSCKKGNSPPYDPTQKPKNISEYNQTTDGLKDYYTSQGYFNMGVAIPASFTDNPSRISLIKRHFNSITAENDMKWSNLQPTEGNFTFSNADKIVAFAQANGLKVRGHTLCWHNQVPDWIFRDGSATASKELVLQRLRTHINTVMTHFKGKVYCWDVVNEAIDDGGSVYRNSQWYSICGEDFIIEAFKAARAADPDAILFYNDYSSIDPVKRDKIYSLLQKLKAQNIVDGMGMQGHWNINYPSTTLIYDAINKYKSLGIQIQITELDVSVYTSNSEPQAVYNDIIAGKLSDAYGRYFEAFRSFKDVITGVTFWGLADDNTWLNNFPVAGRKNYPLLFDLNLAPKKAYFTVIDF